MKDKQAKSKGITYLQGGGHFIAGSGTVIGYDRHHGRITVKDGCSGADIIHYDKHGNPYTECSEQVGVMSVIVPRAYDDDLRRMARELCEENDGMVISEDGIVGYWTVEGENTIYLTKGEAERNAHNRWIEYVAIDRVENPQLFDLIDFMRHYPTFIYRLAGGQE